MLKLSPCHCYSVLYLIYFHWKLTRFPLSPAVLLLTGLSRSNWNLVNLNRSDCCGIPIVLLWGLFFKERQKKKKNTGADFDYYLCALKTILFCSSELRTVRYFWPFVLRPFFKVLPAWAETVMENGGFFVQGFCFFLMYVCKWADSSCRTPLTPTLIPSSLCYPSSSSTKWNAATTILKCFAYWTVFTFTFIFFTYVHFLLPDIVHKKTLLLHRWSPFSFLTHLCNGKSMLQKSLLHLKCQS